MTDESDIVNILREEEKLEKLRNQDQSNYEQLSTQDKMLDEARMQKNDVVEDNVKNVKKHIELGNIEEIYKVVFENSAVAITVTDENEQILFWNKYAEDLLNMREEDLYLKPISSLYPHEEWRKIRSENVRQKGMQHHLETRILRKNSEPLDVDISISVLKDNEGRVIGSIGIIKDISEKKEAERRLSSIMECADDSVYLLDKDCRYIMVNNELLSRFNLPEEDVLGKTFAELHSPEETRGFTVKINSVFENGKPVKDEHFKHDRWFLRTLSPIKDHITNQTTAVAIISKDITDRKTTEIKLKTSEERYRTIFESSAVAITLTDENEQIISWNKYAEKLFEMDDKDLYLKPIDSLYPPEEWRKIRSENVRQKGMQHHLETRILRKNSEPLDVDISISVLKDDEGRVIGSIGIIKDISDRKRAEMELKEAHKVLNNVNKQLEQKVKERTAHIEELLRQKDEFIGQLGHDLKTPLSILMNLMPMIKDDTEKPRSKEDCDMAIRNVKYIQNLVTETLKIAELSSSNVKFDIQDVNLSDLVDSVIKDNQFVFEEKNIEIEKMIDENIVIQADKLRVGEIFNNLISNAVKYSGDNGGTITIDVQNDGDSVTISVKDTGIGMTEEQLDHIFDEFYKVDESRHSLGSSGLGLSICKRIVEKLGGKIWAESPGINSGSTFFFTLKMSNNKETYY